MKAVGWKARAGFDDENEFPGKSFYVYIYEVCKVNVYIRVFIFEAEVRPSGDIGIDIRGVQRAGARAP